jgi:hypothetical protein
MIHWTWIEAHMGRYIDVQASERFVIAFVGAKLMELIKRSPTRRPNTYFIVKRVKE